MNVKKIDGVIKTSSPVASRVRNAKQTVMDVFLREKELAKQKGDVFVRNMCDYHSDYDYLEEMADEASAYMTEAVNSYVLMYGDDSYTVNMEEYANENYARAYKRVNIILALLRGETPDEEGLTIQ